MISRLHTIFKYDNKRAIDVLATDLLDNMPPLDRKILLCRKLIKSGLILPPCGDFGRTFILVAPWPLDNFAINVIVKGLEITYQLDLFITKTVCYMVQGKDTTDPRSAGGWNGMEFSTFLNILNSIGYTYDGDPWWFVEDLHQNIENNKINKDT